MTSTVQGVRGTWWIAGKRSQRVVVGSLSVDHRRGRAELDLDGPLLAHWLPDGTGHAVRAEPAVTAAIHGQTTRGRVTLLNPYAWDETVYATAVVVGAWIDPTEDGDPAPAAIDDLPIFYRIEVELEDLHTWVGASALTHPLNASRHDGDPIASYRQPPAVRASLTDGTTVSVDWRVTTQRESRRSGRGVLVNERVVLDVRPPGPASINALLDHVYALRHLIGFAVGRDPAALALRLQCAGKYSGTREDASVDLHVPHVRAPDPGATSVDPRDVLFTAVETSFSALIPGWYEQFEKLRGPILALGGARDPNAAGENRLLNAATAAENLHRRLDPSARAMPTSEFNALKQTIMSAVAADQRTARYAPWLRERLHNDHTLEQRLDLLLDRLPDRGHRLLVGDANSYDRDLQASAWKWATRKGRNDIAHQGITRTLNGDAAYTAILTTAAVVELTILCELGFDELHLANVVGRRHENIAQLIHDHLVPPYQAR